MPTMLREFPNHYIEGDTVRRGEMTGRIIKPNESGIYTMLYKGETSFRTIHQLKHEQEQTALTGFEEIKDEDNPHDADVIEMHMQGLSGREIANALQEDITYVEITKKKFIGESAFYLILKRFNVERHFIKRRYGVRYNALTNDEKLSYLIRALREHRDKKSKAQMFAEAGLNYKAVAQWMSNRGVSVTEENAEECMLRYLSERKERKKKE